MIPQGTLRTPQGTRRVPQGTYRAPQGVFRNPVQPLSISAGLIFAIDPSTDSNPALIPAAYGTSKSLTVAGSPSIASQISPAGNNMLQTLAANSPVGSFTSTGALAACSYFEVRAPIDLSGSTTLPMVSKSTSTTQSYARWVMSSLQIFRLEFRLDAGTAGVCNLSTPQLMNVGQSAVCGFTYDGAQVIAYVNGIAGTPTAKTGTFTFDQLLTCLGTQFATGLVGRVGIWNRALTPGEVTALSSRNGIQGMSFGNDVSTGQYVSDISGNDTTNYGFSSFTPLKTIAAAQAKTTIISNTITTGGNTLYLGDASTFVGQTITPPSSGTTTARVAVRPYTETGGNGRARAVGCAANVGGWTSGGGSLYSQPWPYKPNFFQLTTGNTNPRYQFEKLYDKTLGTPPGATYFDYAGGILTISAPGYFNPATTPFYVAANDSNGCMQFGTTNVDVYNLDMWMWNSLTFQPSATTGSVNTFGCTGSYGFNDSFDSSSGAGAIITHNSPYAAQAGGVPNISGTGDLYSCHGSSVVVYNNAIGYDGQSGGIRSEQHTTETVNGGIFGGSVIDFIRLAQGSGTNGLFTINNVQIELGALSTGVGIELDAATAGTGQANLVVNFATVVPKGVTAQTTGVLVAAGTGTVKDLIAESLHGGLQTTGTGTITEGNNCFHNVAFPTTGTITNVGPDITSDPLFVDFANGNYALQLGSPCIGAGVAIAGVTTDITGATRANPPSIGAYEA